MRAITLLLICLPAFAQPLNPLVEQRYCGPPSRNAAGEILRSSAVLTAFKRAHPCPVTGLSTGACPGWAIDHIIPLACEGCDAVSNLAWMPNAIKSCAGTICKDRWERKIYCQPMQIVPAVPNSTR